jgi:hypothetical protein
MKLKITKSNNPKKKYKAVFMEDNVKVKTTHFGAKGMSDYTIHKDKERRKNYRKRHRKDLKTNDPMRAGYLSYYILWGDDTNFNTNVEKFKEKFNFSC